MPTIKRKRYTSPDGKIQHRKPAIWNNTTPITDEYLEANGWTIEEAIEIRRHGVPEIVNRAEARSLAHG